MGNTIVICRALSYAALVSLGSGCGGNQRVLVPVTGVITLDGTAVSEVIVNFAPIGTTEGSGALGATDAEGRFELTDVRGSSGTHPGKYKVHLYPAPLNPPTDVPVDVVSRGGRGVPAIYIDPNRTPVTLEVPPTGGHVTIRLSRQRKKDGQLFQQRWDSASGS